ncbi:MAG: putative glycoside hydrolase [Desulfobaccales bacterium]
MKKIETAWLILLAGLLLLTVTASAQEGKAGDGPKAAEPQAATPQSPEGKAPEPPAASEPKPPEAAKALEGQKTEAPAGQPSDVGAATKTITGKVVDATTKKPIADAPVTLGDRQVRTDQEGAFRIEGSGKILKLRAAGYKRREVPLSDLQGANPEITLDPFRVKALYLSVYGSASKNLRAAALEALERNQMNALVIDIKGDRGLIPFKVDLPLAEEAGAQKTILFKDYPAFIKSLKEKNLYLIARIVVFKDDPLAAAKPQWAVKTKGGGVFYDRERLRWIDAFHTEAWDYYLSLAKIGAELGFDEIQFDYVRFPDSPKVSLARPSTVESRTKAITGFLEAAYKALITYNVFVAADIFGYVPWNSHDTDIGQQIVPITKAVDIVSLMVYPSGYHLGIPKYRNPVQHPYEIVYLTHKRALERTQVSPLRFRPWLQAFRDYAFRGGDFTEERMRIQIKAANDFGASGFMFWNPRNVYPTGVFNSGEAKRQAKRSQAVKTTSFFSLAE